MKPEYKNGDKQMAKTVIKKILKAILIIIAVIVLLAALLVAYLTATEYRPDERIKLDIKAAQEQPVEAGKPIRIMTWNIGYGALGDNADFFMDGGRMVNTATKARLSRNLKDIGSEIAKADPDIMFMQEVDLHSARSHYVNELDLLSMRLPGRSSSFAYNFKVKFIPYPVPPIGQVNSGITTFSRYKVNSAERVKLPSPFKWPVKVANLKRCLLVSKLPVSGTDKKLVLINLHLEAFDDGSGKIAQTKALRKIMREEYDKGNYVVVAGDFNQTFSNIDSSMYPARWGSWQAGRIEAADFGEDFNLFMDNGEPSCRSNNKVYRDEDKETYQYFLIDGYIVSKNVKVENIRTENLQFKASDHNPVFCTITLSR